MGHIDEEIDTSSKLTESMVNTCNDSEHLKAIIFKSVSYDHKFPEKKVNVSASSISSEGILKSSWLLKHHCLLPSVVVLFFQFGSDWVAGEWAKREIFMAETHAKFKLEIVGRDVKLLVVMIRTGPETIEKEALEERMSSIKKRIATDSKFLFVYSDAVDYTPNSPTARRLGKTVRELSNNYYKTHSKYFRRLDKVSGHQAQPIFFARYNFKAAIYCDFLGQVDKSLKHYQDSFLALANVANTVRPIDFDMVDVFSGWLNYRICRLLLLTASINEVAHQFRVHISLFGKNYRGVHKWMHYSWLAQQYLVYEDLLKSNSVSQLSVDTDKKFFCLNVAKYLTKAARECSRASKNIDTQTIGNHTLLEMLQSKQPDITVCEPIFCGGMPVLFIPEQHRYQRLSEVESQVVTAHWLLKESKKDHADVAIGYLNTALESIGIEQVRARAQIQALVGDQVYNIQRLRVY